MRTKRQTALLTAALLLFSATLAGCETTSSPSMESSGVSSEQAQETPAQAQESQGAPAVSIASLGVIKAIDVVSQESAGVGADTAGSGTAEGGQMGGQGTAKQAYRITLQMEDGSERAYLQESLPTFNIGDRVRIIDGMIQGY